MKTCKQSGNTYSSDLFKNRMKLCNYCREQNKIKNDETKKQWKLNNPERVKGYRKNTKKIILMKLRKGKRNGEKARKGKQKYKNTGNKFIIANCVITKLKKKRSLSTRNL